MKIKSTMVMNTSILAAHGPSVKDGKVVIGGGASKSLNIPAGSTIELADAVWLKDFAVAAKDLLAAGDVVIVEDVKLSKADKVKANKAKAADLKAQLKALETFDSDKAVSDLG
tara:strand:+ start:7664 stop:8002 length:339 start_codon:yes stop_codon:yes gene_type:complete